MFFFLADPQAENFLDSNNHHSQLLISFESKYTGIMKELKMWRSEDENKSLPRNFGKTLKKREFFCRYGI